MLSTLLSTLSMRRQRGSESIWDLERWVSFRADLGHSHRAMAYTGPEPEGASRDFGCTFTLGKLPDHGSASRRPGAPIVGYTGYSALIDT